jgi:hypothetical protein
LFCKDESCEWRLIRKVADEDPVEVSHNLTGTGQSLQLALKIVRNPAGQKEMDQQKILCAPAACSGIGLKKNDARDKSRLRPSN